MLSIILKLETSKLKQLSLMKAKIDIIQGDLTTLDVGAIVNAANHSLLGGGGVDGAIHKAAGRELLAECRTLGGCATGEAKITSGYQLPAQFVIHTVGPIWRGGMQGEAELLASCYFSSLKIASDRGLKTIAFPAISCGVYRYPVEEAAKVAIASTLEFLESDNLLEKIIFVCFGDRNYQAYLDAAKTARLT